MALCWLSILIYQFLRFNQFKRFNLIFTTSVICYLKAICRPFVNCHVLFCRYSADTASGKAEVKDHLLDDVSDDLWGQLRHEHIAGGVAVIVLAVAQAGDGQQCVA